MTDQIHEITHGSGVWCKHYRGMHDKTECEAGIAFAAVRVDGEWRYRYKGEKTVYTAGACYPCLVKSNYGGATCPKLEVPTAEEVAAEEAEYQKLFERTRKARAAIVAHLGGPWKRGMPSIGGEIDCPVCGAEQSLRFSRAGINGHIRATCKTEDCVRWME